MLSAQSTDVGANKATRRLFPAANTPQALLDLALEGLEGHIKTIGLYHSKARHLLQTCKMLVDLHGGQVPRNTRKRWRHCWRRAQNCQRGFERGAGGSLFFMAVDTHIFRVSNRTGLAPGKTPLTVEHGLLEAIPSAYLVDAHHWLILHEVGACGSRLGPGVGNVPLPLNGPSKDKTVQPPGVRQLPNGHEIQRPLIGSRNHCPPAQAHQLAALSPRHE
ncbi:MAG: endonuclease III [Betaproteobacteria bacterium]|nr:endonuclease III [Betaproteobacteria bacterium]